MFTVQRLNRSEIHRNAVLDHSILFQYLIEKMQRASALEHEIFGDDFEPVDDRFLFQNVLVVRDAQPDTYAVVGKPVESIRQA